MDGSIWLPASCSNTLTSRYLTETRRSQPTNFDSAFAEHASGDEGDREFRRLMQGAEVSTNWQSHVTPHLSLFGHTGVDYWGKLTVTPSQRSEKRYVMFTCMTTRTVDLRVAYSLTTQAYLIAIWRFVWRKGKQIEFYSENGTNFQATNRKSYRGSKPSLKTNSRIPAPAEISRSNWPALW